MERFKQEEMILPVSMEKLTKLENLWLPDHEKFLWPFKFSHYEKLKFLKWVKGDNFKGANTSVS